MSRFPAALVFALAACGVTVAGEIHVVALYEGHNAPRDRSKPGTAAVTVDRPGKEVVLVVSASEAVEWEVTATPKTKLTKVVMGGYRRQSVKAPAGVDIQEMSVECRRQRILPVSIYAPYSLNSERLRPFIQTLNSYTGGLEIDSFQGTNSFDPTKPFVVDAVQNDERLSSKFPKVTPVAELPEFKFSATRLVMPVRGRTWATYGEYTRTGPEKDRHTALPRDILQVALDTRAKRYYGITGHELHEVDLRTGTSVKLEPPMGVDPNWLRALTYDAKRERLLVTGRNAMYEYGTKTGNWAVLVPKNTGSFSAIAWQGSTDTLFAVGNDEHAGFRPGERPGGAWLYELNPAGLVVKATQLGSPAFPTLYQGGAFDRAELIDLGGKLATFVLRENRDSSAEDQSKPEAFLYLIDPKTGKVQLAWKE